MDNQTMLEWEPVELVCECCGKPIRRKTKSGRAPKYCRNGRCKSAAWRARQKEGATHE